MVKISERLFDTPFYFLLFCAYIPTANSPYYDSIDESNGLVILENCMSSICSSHTDCRIILCGDLNSRTRNFNTTDLDLFDVRSEAVVETRSSRDNGLND